MKLNAWKPGTEDHVDHSVLREYIQDTSQTSGVDSSTVYNTRVDNVLKEGIIWHVHTSTLSRHERFDSKRRRLERRQWVGTTEILRPEASWLMWIPGV